MLVKVCPSKLIIGLSEHYLVCIYVLSIISQLFWFDCPGVGCEILVPNPVPSGVKPEF